MQHTCVAGVRVLSTDEHAGSVVELRPSFEEVPAAVGANGTALPA